MPLLTEARRKERRDEIAQATLRCFARQGFANTSVADIIKEAGLSAGSIYSHFSSKAELLRYAVSSALESRFTALIDDVKARRGEIAPAELLTRLVGDARIESAQARVLLEVWAEVPRDAELAALVQENLHTLRAMIAGAIGPWVRSHRSRSSSRATEVADALLAALLGYVVRISLDADTPREEVLRGIAGCFKSKAHTKGTT